MAEPLRKPAAADTPLYREAPNNIEAEQALLGAILLNNDAFYRVSDFLKPGHFYEPLHRKIYEVVGELIRMGKIASPVTIKTFLPTDAKVGDMTIPFYVARLVAEAVTVINAADYGRAIYDLAQPDRSRWIVSTGQSGQPLSPYYVDQASLWAEGRYLTMSMDRRDFSSGGVGTLSLRPAGPP